MVREVTGVATATATLGASGWRTKPAIVALLAGVEVPEALERLEGVTLRPLYLAERPWPDDLRDRLLALLPLGSTSARELALLDTAIGRVVGEVAAAAIADPGRRRPGRVTGADAAPPMSWPSTPGRRAACWTW